jgi:hypothetical protein
VGGGIKCKSTQFLAKLEGANGQPVFCCEPFAIYGFGDVLNFLLSWCSLKVGEKIKAGLASFGHPRPPLSKAPHTMHNPPFALWPTVLLIFPPQDGTMQTLPHRKGTNGVAVAWSEDIPACTLGPVKVRVDEGNLNFDYLF